MRGRLKTAAVPLTLLYIDIDDFKAVDATRGHQKGDEALSMLSSVLREVSRESDILARLDGDEFCAVLPGVDDMGTNIFGARFIRRLQEREASITVSIGLSRTGPVDFDEPDILLQMAGTRMYEEKAQHHNGPRRNDTASAA